MPLPGAGPRAARVCGGRRGVGSRRGVRADSLVNNLAALHLDTTRQSYVHPEVAQCKLLRVRVQPHGNTHCQVTLTTYQRGRVSRPWNVDDVSDIVSALVPAAIHVLSGDFSECLQTCLQRLGRPSRKSAASTIPSLADRFFGRFHVQKSRRFGPMVRSSNWIVVCSNVE